jgi:glycerol-3-phosphate acyltransferase PlsY
MSAVQQLLTLVAIAYVVGSIPFGLIVGLSKGVDPRKAGSGNIGATNVGRLLGGKFFALVFVLDLLKGMLPSLAASWVVYRHGEATGGGVGWEVNLLWLLVGFAAVAGHMFSMFLKFKGGKGVATSAGITLGVFPDYTAAGVAIICIFVVTLMATRIVSLASMLGTASFPFAYAAVSVWRGKSVWGERWPLMTFAILVVLMILWKHRANIARIRAGTEPRVTSKRARAAG